MDKLILGITGEEIRLSKLDINDLISVKVNSKLNEIYDLDLFRIDIRVKKQRYEFDDIIVEIEYNAVLNINKFLEEAELKERLEVGL